MIAQKVVVAMSGGVDSSVAAYLLKEQGFQVIGMMMRLWSEPGRENSNRCCTPDSMAQAKMVASKLQIPFYVIDSKEIFFNKVVRSFISGYASGITPNPCLECNRWIRFDHLYQHAKAFGADYFSTGHYAQKFTHQSGLLTIKRAIDEQKDQSYVLHVIPSSILPDLLFPIGVFSKDQIREIARDIGLTVAKRPDSQDLCFLSGGDYRGFLQRNGGSKDVTGNVVNMLDNEIISKHRGLSNYTIGQRKGLGFSSDQPYYVISKDLSTNTLFVGPVTALGHQIAYVRDVNWLIPITLLSSNQVMVKSRYTASLVPAEIFFDQIDNSVQLVFQNPQRDLTPGQAAVFYQNDFVIGGGMITSTSTQ